MEGVEQVLLHGWVVGSVATVTGDVVGQVAPDGSGISRGTRTDPEGEESDVVTDVLA